MSEYFPYGNAKEPFNQIPLNNSDRPIIVGDRYELLRVIGSGAMSYVYLGRDKVLDRLVAVKLLRDEYGSDPSFVARFYREARAVASFTAENIAAVYDYGKYDKSYFIVMQYVEGSDLKEIIQQQGRLPVEQAVLVTEQLLKALAVAHARGIIHRDVKPQNILIRASDGAVKLTDFGVAYARDGADITAAGGTIGTANYMAPEQASGQPIGPATDLYAAGVVLFEMLSGKLPFQGTNPVQIMLKHVNELPPTFASLGLGQEIPRELEQIVRRALAKDPTQRYQSAKEMSNALAPFLRSSSTSSYSPINPGSTVVKPRAELEQIYPSRPISAAQSPALSKLLLPLLIGLLVLVVGGLAWFALTALPRSAQQSTSTGVAAAVINTPGVNVVPRTTPSALSGTTAATTVSSPTETSPPAVVILPPNTSLPTATTNPAALATLTPVPALPTATSLVLPPTATRPPALPTSTKLPVAPTPRTVQPAPPTNSDFSPYLLEGTYKRDDGTLYGRPEVALYGAGSDYSQGAVSFRVNTASSGAVQLRITGLDDERAEHCNFQILVNDTEVFAGPNTFPNVSSSDNGVGGEDRYWGQMTVTIPAGVLKVGTNTLTLRNNTPWLGYIGIPYILINSVEFVP